MHANTQSAEEIIRAYKDAVIRAKGSEYANATEVTHSAGWFWVRHADGTDKKYRHQQLLAFTVALSESEFEPDAYAKAMAARHSADTASARNSELMAEWAPATQLTPRLRRSGRRFNWGTFWISIIALFGGAVVWLLVSGTKGKDRATAPNITNQPTIATTDTQQPVATRSSQMTRSKFFPEPDSGFVTTLANLRPGTELYWRSDFRFYGVVTALKGDRVEVALRDSVSMTKSSMRLDAVWHERSHVTKNFVTKK
jgi:hypothetical protein